MKKIQDTCACILKSIPGALKWEYDGRFNAALITLDRTTAESAKDDIASCFEHVFDEKTIKKGTKQEIQLSKTLFGLSKGQFLFICNDEEQMLFAAWWPWGDNSKVSLRVGFFPLNGDSLSQEQILASLKSWFKIN